MSDENNSYTPPKPLIEMVSFWVVVIFFSVLTILGGMYGCPIYSVWEQGLSGEAELKKAEWNRQIKVKEAEAHLQSAKSLADAEIVRAHGVAEANKIIGKSLNGNEAYLRYLWISNLTHENTKEVIYVPTEAGMPILEAGKR